MRAQEFEERALGILENLEHRVDRASNAESVVDGPEDRVKANIGCLLSAPRQESPKKATGLGPGHVWKH
jgi:hypothetical protein